MPRGDQDENEKLYEASDSIEGAVTDALGEAFKDPEDDDGPRDTAIGRWLKFLVIITFLGVLVAGLAAWMTYAGATRFHHRHYSATNLTDQQWNDTLHDIRRNSVIGFCIGAAIGGSYVIKCLVRNVDP